MKLAGFKNRGIPARHFRVMLFPRPFLARPEGSGVQTMSWCGHPPPQCTTHKHISPVVLESPENPTPHGGATQLGQHHMDTSRWRKHLTHHVGPLQVKRGLTINESIMIKELAHIKGLKQPSKPSSPSLSQWSLTGQTLTARGKVWFNSRCLMLSCVGTNYK